MSSKNLQFENIQLVLDGPIATICLNRPDAANGLNSAMAAELALAAHQVANDEKIKAVILTGSGRFFCAGGDIQAMADFGDNVGYGIKSLADDLHKAISCFARMNAPLIVAVNGTAAGAGFSMAIVGDLVVSANSAKFTMAYTKAGLSPDGSSTYFLPRLVGMRKAQELMYTNRVLNAVEAQNWGLVNTVVDDENLMEEAVRLADIFVAGAKGSNATVKQLLLESFNNSLETQMELEGRGISRSAESADGKEGVSAFLEKRTPKFK